MNFQFVAAGMISRDHELYQDAAHPWAAMKVYRHNTTVDRVEFWRHGDLICTVHGNTRATADMIDALYFPE